ncbi:MAG: hypothetical protein JWP26_3233 [Devosia sp.]|uniref:hypothetical protein n=1 Tax=Devosia sp. TaxID=1871048 RepID=UPI002610CCCA|nr:hypothetical protein [Devosia sp.]MDB5535681.1 hypothetical protein [Devosia sp.]MDB5588263.1 hypothetical protein [Devosia sp.]
MRSWDPMRNFPELDALSAAEAKALVVKTQREVTRQPMILLGLAVTLAVAGVAIFYLVPLGGLTGGAIMGAMVALFGVVYMVVVIKPRMQAEFRKQGFPH